MADIDLDALRAAAEAATPGPWESYDANEGDYPHMPLCCVANDEFHNPTSDEKPSIHLMIDCSQSGKQDAAFIAAANPAVVLALIDRLRKAEAARCSMLATLRMIAWSNNSKWQADAANQEIAKFHAAPGSTPTDSAEVDHG